MGAIIGIKKYMTQIFTKDGNVVACTAVDTSNVRVVGKRTKEKDGYEALILGLGKRKKPTKADIGKFKSAEEVPWRSVEFRCDKVSLPIEYKVGEAVDLSQFKVDEKLAVTGITKGKGFQGVVKRWAFKGGPKTHGQSSKLRSPGSISGGTCPGRVYKGKKMAGRMGGVKQTVKGLKVVKIDDKNHILCIKGALPGSVGSLVKIYSFQRQDK